MMANDSLILKYVLCKNKIQKIKKLGRSKSVQRENYRQRKGRKKLQNSRQVQKSQYCGNQE